MFNWLWKIVENKRSFNCVKTCSNCKREYVGYTAAGSETQEDPQCKNITNATNPTVPVWWLTNYQCNTTSSRILCPDSQKRRSYQYVCVEACGWTKPTWAWVITGSEKVQYYGSQVVWYTSRTYSAVENISNSIWCVWKCDSWYERNWNTCKKKKTTTRSFESYDTNPWCSNYTLTETSFTCNASHVRQCYFVSADRNWWKMKYYRCEEQTI